MLAETSSQAAHETAEKAGGLTFDPGEKIVGHLLDHDNFEITYGVEIPLPHFEPLWGVLDLSITKHVAMMWMAGLVILLIGWLAARRRNEAVPTGLRNAIEVIVRFIRDEVARKSIHGADADRYTPYLLSTFFFIWTCSSSAAVGVNCTHGCMTGVVVLALPSSPACGVCVSLFVVLEPAHIIMIFSSSGGVDTKITSATIFVTWVEIAFQKILLSSS